MKRAMLIASSQFPHDKTITELRYPIADVSAMGEVLCAPGLIFRLINLSINLIAKLCWH
jgi:hypothetical protein